MAALITSWRLFGALDGVGIRQCNLGDWKSIEAMVGEPSTDLPADELDWSRSRAAD